MVVCRPSHRCPHPGRAGHLVDCIRESVDVPFRHDQPGLAVAHDFGDVTVIGCNNGHSGRRQLNQRYGRSPFAVTVRGVPAHPREPESGLSAIEAAFLVIAALKELETRWTAEKSSHPGFDALANPASLNIGTIRGGEWPASIPFECSFEGRIGFYPGDRPQDRMEELRAVLEGLGSRDRRLEKADPRLEWIGTCQAGYRLDDGSDAEAALAVAHRTVTGEPLERSIMACYLDAALYMNHCGIPSLTYGPLTRNIHGIDECVNLPSLKRVTQAIALFAAAWCGVAPISRDR